MITFTLQTIREIFVTQIMANTFSTLENIQFWVIAPIMVASALGVCFAKKPVHAVVSILGVMIPLAFIYVTHNAPFLAVTQIVVYSGAILMMFLFVIMLVGTRKNSGNVENTKNETLKTSFVVRLKKNFVGTEGKCVEETVENSYPKSLSEKEDSWEEKGDSLEEQKCVGKFLFKIFPKKLCVTNCCVNRHETVAPKMLFIGITGVVVFISLLVVVTHSMDLSGEAVQILDRGENLGESNPSLIAKSIFTKHYFTMHLAAIMLVSSAIGAMLVLHSGKVVKSKTQKELLEEKMRDFAMGKGHLGQKTIPGVYAISNASNMENISGETGQVIEESVFESYRVSGSVGKAPVGGIEVIDGSTGDDISAIFTSKTVEDETGLVEDSNGDYRHGDYEDLSADYGNNDDSCSNHTYSGDGDGDISEGDGSNSVNAKTEATETKTPNTKTEATETKTPNTKTSETGEKQ